MRKILSIVLAFAMLFAFAIPVSATGGFPGDSDPLPLLPNQYPVYLDGAATDLLEAVYTGNSANIPDWNKISANREEVNIAVNGVNVGYFVFDKKGNAPKPYTGFLKIEIFDSILDLEGTAQVYIRWHCSKYYAYADLSAPGVYYIPQLMQNNGKFQSFDQIWVGTSYTPPEDPEVYGGIAIKKTVDGQWIGEQYGPNMSDFANTIFFDIYKLTGEGGELGEKVGTSNLGIDGYLRFGNLAPGWYAIVERFEPGSLAERIFVAGKRLDVQVIENEIVGQETVIESKDGENGLVAVTEDLPFQDWGYMPTKWSNAILNPPELDGAQWVWDTANPSAAYGIDGSIISTSIDFELNELPASAMFYLACDNAAVVYVNGKYAISTYLAIDPSHYPAIQDATFAFEQDKLLANDIDGSKWQGQTGAYVNNGVYFWDIAPLLNEGNNTITIIAANSASTGAYVDGVFVPGTTGTLNDDYNLENNPAGLIFKCVIPGLSFDNELLS